MKTGPSSASVCLGEASLMTASRLEDLTIAHQESHTMSSEKKSVRSETTEDRTSRTRPQQGVEGTTEELQRAIDRLRIEVHSLKHPLEKIRCYEEIKRLQDELSKRKKEG